ncbi:MAG: hypothetical protein KGH63_04530, partial [Candidatus Micrarchaeota archaeon]|nr:hypothetical protein [Candidatus Micrarchaeota archaeon]
ETYNPVGAPRPAQDPAIMISYATGPHEKDAHVLTFKDVPHKPFVKNCGDEKGMIEALGPALSAYDCEVLAGYNSTGFDLPYLQARAAKTKAKLSLGRDGSSFTIRRRGIRDIAKIKGRIYVDLLPMLRFLSFIGAVKLSAFSLKVAYAELTGHKAAAKEKMDRLDIYKMWDDPAELPELAEYSASDARITWELAQLVLPLELEMAKVTCLPLNDVVGATASVLVESLLMHEAAARGAVVPNKPSDEVAKARMLNPIQGAYVRTPPPGIYENMIVFDFRGLYPSIITSHNIDPFMLNCDCCTKAESFVSPTGARFCKKRRGLIPDVLEKVIKQRGQLKDELKKLSPGSDEYRAMFARQQSLKILANSYYGYLAFSRSRYYSRECAESVTAWGRHYITQTGEQAEKAGYRVLYQDTDSLFLLLEGKKPEDAISWMKHLNSTLPHGMELELEAFYPRGVFVSKKIAGESAARGGGANGGADATGAKKKYALIDEKGRIKIRGFELVRRDWSVIARETQRRVLEAILKDGSKEKAVAIVKEVVEQIRSGSLPIEKFVIETALTKPLDKYAITSPELEAAKKANARGRAEKLEQGSVVRYVVTRSGSAGGEMMAHSGTAPKAAVPKPGPAKQAAVGSAHRGAPVKAAKS